ncbi:MAG: hypothetical protein ACJ76F_12250 [Bacteroidia bacterium]
MRTGLRYITALFCMTLFLSCGSDTPTEEPEDLTEDASEMVNEVQKTATQNIFNSVPAPDEVADLVNRSGADYDPLILNNPDNYTKYTSEDFKAINLGVYGTDLSYTSVFEQTQESMLFLKCVNQTCKSLGISGVFDEKTFDRIEANKENKDSLLQIISKSFWQADAFLKENQRAHTSSLMVAGGWIEGMYLALNIAKVSPDKKIRQKIAEQKSSLNDLIALLENSKVSADVAFILNDLKQIPPVFDIPASAETKDKKTPATGQDDPFIKALDEKISVLRKKITMN